MGEDRSDLDEWTPYFMTNKEWYRRVTDEKGSRLELTDKAPKEAVESYKEFYTPHYTKDGDMIHY